MNIYPLNKPALEYDYDSPVWNSNSGLCSKELYDMCADIELKYHNFPKQIVKSKIIECILTNAQIGLNPDGIFSDRINHSGIMQNFISTWKQAVNTSSMKEILDKYNDLQSCRAFTGDVDFGHTCPDWFNVLNKGLTGILSEINMHLNNPDLSEGQKNYYIAAQTVYNSAITYILRLSNEAMRLSDEYPHLVENAKCLKHIATAAPQTLYHAMQLIFIYYMLQQNIDCINVRSLGGLDTLLYPFYKHDIENGIITVDDARIMLQHFMFKFYTQKTCANIPFYICGSDLTGNDLTNEFTYLILEEYIHLDVDDPKIHIRCHHAIPDDILKIVLKSIRAGKNSFVFMNDTVIEQALEKIGIEPDDAHNYTIVGCYEPTAANEVPCSCNGRINIPKAIELALTNGRDILCDKQIIKPFTNELTTFDDFISRVKDILRYFCTSCMDIITKYEQNYMEINPSQFFSSTMQNSISGGKDVYAGGAKYNNSSINAFGLATAVDSLIAVKKAVFEEHFVSLEQMADAINNNWRGYEKLQLKCRNTYPKYGNDNDECNNIMVDLCSSLADYINGKPNGRSGVYRLGLFSIDWRFEFGEYTSATPDGRNAHETISKNMSSVLGCDKAGITSLINSVTKIDYTNVPNGTVLDIVLHYTAASGEEGLTAMLGLLKAYLNANGNAIQFNVLNPSILREAQKHPEQYKTLQVRLCGWNVYFVDLTKKEQDEFIIQTEHMA